MIGEARPSLTGEDLKRAFGRPDPERSKDALHGVTLESPFSRFAANATVGPYNGELSSPDVSDFLSDPAQVLVVGCGRNEAGKKNLGPVLRYMQESTRGAGNTLYVDGNSTDDSVALAHSTGIDTLRRRDVFPGVVDRQALADILFVPVPVLEGKEIPGYPPLRKGIELFIARVALMKMHQDGKAPKYVSYIDTDLWSIPGGKKEKELREQDPELIYRPLELATAGTLELNGRRMDGKSQLAVFTGSEKRNNEAIFELGNLLEVDAVSPYHDKRQREIADALRFIPDIIVHPLTGELIVSTEAELNSMGATGQAVEIARILSLTGNEYQAFGTLDPEELSHIQSLTGIARRGKQQRVDEPQLDKKEWWMIIGVLPQFWKVVTDHAIQTRRLPHEFTLDDYAFINRWLSGVKRASRLNNETQTKEVDFYPGAMERAIPPVSLLQREGILKI